MLAADARMKGDTIAASVIDAVFSTPSSRSASAAAAAISSIADAGSRTRPCAPTAHRQQPDAIEV